MTIYLVDINVLLPLADPMHIHHEAAHEWFRGVGEEAWATCPITENGFIRIASHPSYPNRPGDVSAVKDILREICDIPGHHFWHDTVSILDLLPSATLVSNAQITDIYLLGLAAHHGGKLATFDRRIPVNVIPHGTEALELIPFDHGTHAAE